MTDFEKARRLMTERDIRARGVRDGAVLAAMASIPREAFIPPEFRDRAYEDTALPIGEGQMISQPYIVAFMLEALALKGSEKALEIGSGSGYAAALLSKLCAEVFAIERIERLASASVAALQEIGIRNVRLRVGDGSAGWPEEGPFDAILVSASARKAPQALKEQLKIGGRMVIPLGRDPVAQELVRITRISRAEFKAEDIADVRFAPLIGEEAPAAQPPRDFRPETAPGVVSRATEDFETIESADLRPLLRRIGQARVVLIGEASHGTSEFYRMRQRITRVLIEEKGFNFVAAEADWPDAARIDRYVRRRDAPMQEWTAFARFPTWMWRNAEVRGFVDWLHAWNGARAPDKRVGFHGLDLYSMYSSVRAVLDYLDEADPEAAAIARERYACLSPYEGDPAAYGHAALTSGYKTCEKPVLGVLLDLLKKRQALMAQDPERFFDAVQNAKLIANAERYYRVMYYGSRESWNLRDTHMFETLKAILARYGADAKGVVWAHNSHVGNAAATEMSRRGEFNIGELCRREFGEAVYVIGFGTDHGTVAAASDWDGPMEIKSVRPALDGSYESLFHLTNKRSFILPVSAGAADDVRRELSRARLERAIGVIYRPQTERQSHYFTADLPAQFDEYIWFDESAAIAPLHPHELEGAPDTYPFGI